MRTELDQQAVEILNWTRRKLTLKLPELLAAIYLLPLKRGGEEDHLWTDGSFLYYHPAVVVQDYLERKDSLAAQLLHIIAHGLLLHIEKRQGQQPELFDAVADIKASAFVDRLPAALSPRRSAALRERQETDPNSISSIWYHVGLSLTGDAPFVEPEELREDAPALDLAVALDTSGSCCGDVMRGFLEELLAILRDAGGPRVELTLIQCDAEIQHIQTLTFVAQFLQSSKVARSFFTYYQQYGELIRSGIADQILQGNHAPSVQQTVEEMSFPQRWSLTCILLLRLENLCQNADARQASDALESVLTFYQNTLAGEPQVEFLLNGITGSDPCALHIATFGCDTYRAMAQQLFFQTNSPSVRKMKRILDQAG